MQVKFFIIFESSYCDSQLISIKQTSDLRSRFVLSKLLFLIFICFAFSVVHTETRFNFFLLFVLHFPLEESVPDDHPQEYGHLGTKNPLRVVFGTTFRGILTHGTIENLKWVKFYAR